MQITGSDDWWREIAGPQTEALGDAYRVTFWWRDPAGSETTSPIRRVWIYITGVTDHHHNAAPQTLQRIPYRCLVLANHAPRQLARQLLFYSLRTRRRFFPAAL